MSKVVVLQILNFSGVKDGVSRLGRVGRSGSGYNIAAWCEPCW